MTKADFIHFWNIVNDMLGGDLSPEILGTFDQLACLVAAA